MKKFNWAILIIFLIPFSLIAESQEEFYEKYYSKNLSGWKGIVFICSFDANDKTLKEICQRSISDVELLAAANKINLKTVKSNDFVTASFIASGNEYITLEYELNATQTNSQYDAKAIHARLVFKTYYSNAVENDSKSGDLDNMPRSGDLELWSKAIIGSGSPTDIVTPLSDGAETYIKKALTLFLKYAENS